MSKFTLSTRVGALETEVASLATGQAEILSILRAKAAGTTPVTPQAPKAPKASKAKAAAPTSDAVPFKALQARLKEHKVAGVIPAGVTVRNAIADGLMTATGDLPGAQAAPVVETGSPERKVLKAALKAHKAAGRIPVGVSVKAAIEQGLMDASGALVTKAAKPAKKARKAQIAADVAPEAPAKVRATDGPRNALGRTTPKSEWDARRALAAQGYSTARIDAMIAAASAVAGA